MAIETGRMPDDLAAIYRELWPEVVWLASAWEDFRSLFADKATVEVLNDTAPAFFYDLQRTLQQSAMLHLCRLTDTPEMNAKGGKKYNLTIKRLPELVDDPTFQPKVQALVDAAAAATDFAREWRNRHLAHTELPAALIGGKTAESLPRAAFLDVEVAVDAIVEVMNALSLYYADNETAYNRGTSLAGGVRSLLYFLQAGRDAEQRK